MVALTFTKQVHSNLLIFSLQVVYLHSFKRLLLFASDNVLTNWSAKMSRKYVSPPAK